MGLNIDELDIKVEASSDNAEEKLEKLIGKLEALKKATNRLSGLDKLAEKLNKIAEGVKSMSGVDKLDKLAESLGKLSQLKSLNVTKAVNSIKKLSEACSSISTTDSLKENITAMVEACKPMESMGKSSFAPFLNSLKKVPEITKSLDDEKIKEFAAMIRQLTAALEPLTTQAAKSGNGLIALNNVIRSTTSRNGNLASSNAATIRSYTSLSSVFKDARVRLLAMYATLREASHFFADCLVTSNEYVENINLFTVAMGDYAEEAYNYAQKVNTLLGIDISEWIRFQGVFKQITTGFGVSAEKSNIMSKNLTQIGYDIASFYNISTEDAMQKVESGISGELEPLRRLGYALDAATLQQIAYDNGIKQNINTMTQAQKSQLRYIAIMQQSTNVMGDMSRTIVTPANSMRILNQQIEQLKRAIGNIVSVFAVKLIPYVQVLIRLLTDAANAIADWLGFELPTIDYSDVGKGLSSVTEEADNATEAVKETQKQLLALAGFDEINQLNLDKGSNDNGNDNTAGNKYDLGIDLPEYDFLAGLDEQTDKLYKQVKAKLKELYEWLKKHKTILKVIAGILATIWAVNKIKNLINWVKSLKSAFSGLAKNPIFNNIKKNIKRWWEDLSKETKKWIKATASELSIGVVGGIIGGTAAYDFFSKLRTKTLDWKSALIDTGIALGAITASFAIGGPIAGCVAIIGTVTGAVIGLSKPISSIADILGDDWFFDNGGVKISALTSLIVSQYKEVNKTAKKLNEYRSTIEKNRTTIEENTGVVETFNKAFGNAKNEMTEDDLNEITNACKTIANAIKENLGLATQSIIDSFTDKTGGLADKLGIDFDNVVGELRGLESELSSNVDDAESIVENYWKMIYDGMTPTAEQTEEYERANGLLIDRATSTNEELAKAKEKMQEAVDFSKIDFQSPEDYEKSLKELTDGTKEAIQSVQDTYNNSMDSINSLYEEAKRDYQYGFMSDEQFARAKQTYESTKKLLEADRDQSINDIKEDYSTLTGAIKNQIDSTIDELTDYYTALDVKIISPGEKISKEDLNSAITEYKKKFGTYWDMQREIQAQYVKENYSWYEDELQKNADNIKIKPDPEKGKRWVEETLSNGITNELPSAQKEIQKGIDLTMSVAAKRQLYWLKTIGDQTSDKVKNNVANNFFDYNREITKGIEDVKLGISGLPTEFSNALTMDLSSAGAETMESFKRGIESVAVNFGGNISTMASFADLNIPAYADGGFPEKGQLFVARENGIPEMVGSVGGQNAVANNAQIEQALFKAVYAAMREADRDTQGSKQSDTVNVRVTADESKIVKVAIDGINDITRRTGKSPIK